MKRRTYEITIPQVPKSVNRGGGGVRASHWAVAVKEKQKWQNWFQEEFMIGGVAKQMLFCGVDVTLRFKGRHHRDIENYRHPVTKPLADALVAGGWLTDDTEEWFKVDGFHLEEGIELSERWRSVPRIKSEMVIKLEACYVS